MAAPQTIEPFWLFGSAIWAHWPTIAVTGVGGVITGFFARRNADRFLFLRPLVTWIGDNKALFTMTCVFLAFIWASFQAFNEEHAAREKAEHASLVPKLNPTKIYQNGFDIAQIGNGLIDAGKNEINFDMITTSGDLDFSQMLEFRDWKILCSGKGSFMTFSGAARQITYTDVKCRIQGMR